MNRFRAIRSRGESGRSEARIRRRLSVERGLTIVEVMVAAMVLVLGAIAIFKIVDAATRTSYRAEQSQVVSNLLQRELERAKALDASEIAIKPNSCSIPLAPELGGRWQPNTFDNRPWVQPGESDENALTLCEQITVADDGSGNDASDVGVDLYRMVVWYDPDEESDQICTPPPEAEEDSNEQVCGMRRIIIGAKPTSSGPGGERAYKEIQSDVVNG